MSITTQPTGVLPVNIPLIYEVLVSIPTVAGETLKQVVITATKISTGETYKIRQNFDTVTSGGGFTTGTARINLSALARSFFCTPFKIEAFGSIGGFFNGLNPQSIDDLGVSFTYDKVNTSGILEDIGVIDIATDITLLNSCRDITDPQNLDAYVTALSNRCFLTNRPEITPICCSDSDVLQYWTTGVNSYRVRIYPTDGGLPRATYIFNDAPSITPDTIASVSAGVVNLNLLSSFLFSEGDTDINCDDFKYTFEAGFWEAIPETFTPVTKEQTFKIVNCCERTKCTLFFLNRLGGVDRYSFDAVKRVSDSPSSSFYEKAINTLVPSEADYGRQKYDSRDKTIITVLSKNICEEVSEWLRELQTSTRVYKQINDTDCISVVIRDSETIIEDLREPIITKSLTLEYSVDPCIQNNI